MRLDDARIWFAKASQDMQTILLVGGSRTTVPSACCFHCQQAAEKALKAVLVALAVEPARTHDIRVLVQILETNGKKMEAALRESAFTLTAYSVQFRYPGLDFEPDASETHAAITAAVSIIEWSIEQLGLDPDEAGLDIMNDPMWDAYAGRV